MRLRNILKDVKILDGTILRAQLLAFRSSRRDYPRVHIHANPRHAEDTLPNMLTQLTFLRAKGIAM